MSLEDYEVLKILGNHIRSSTYKVEHKGSHKKYVWQSMYYDNLSDADISRIKDKLKLRTYSKHPHLVNFYDIIKQDSKLFYIVTEFCQNGSLKDIINNCLKSNCYLSEEFVCKMLYQISFTVKTIDQYSGCLTSNEIFFDDNYNVKLYNFSTEYNDKKLTDLKMHNLGYILFEACTRKAFITQSYEREMQTVSALYSDSLLTTVFHMIQDNGELKNNVNTILCHPLVLLKSSEWCKKKSFLKLNDSISSANKENEGKYETVNMKKLEKLRNKEIALQIREQKLNEREHKLLIREKDIAVKERVIKEKMQKAELYLKKSQDSKALNVISSGTSNSNIVSKDHCSSENLDSTYISCKDSIIVPTSKKLNVNEIVKPTPFTRTMSERRIRFKGHSPLKDIDFNRRKSTKPTKTKKDDVVTSSEWLTCSEENVTSATYNPSRNKKKQLLPKMSKQSLDTTNIPDICRPITWNEENKKYAYELLRIMKDKENKCADVKHTYL